MSERKLIKEKLTRLDLWEVFDQTGLDKAVAVLQDLAVKYPKHDLVFEVDATWTDLEVWLCGFRFETEKELLSRIEVEQRKQEATAARLRARKAKIERELQKVEEEERAAYERLRLKFGAE